MHTSCGTHDMYVEETNLKKKITRNGVLHVCTPAMLDHRGVVEGPIIFA